MYFSYIYTYNFICSRNLSTPSLHTFFYSPLTHLIPPNISTTFSFIYFLYPLSKYSKSPTPHPVSNPLPNTPTNKQHPKSLHLPKIFHVSSYFYKPPQYIPTAHFSTPLPNDSKFHPDRRPFFF